MIIKLTKILFVQSIIDIVLFIQWYFLIIYIVQSIIET